MTHNFTFPQWAIRLSSWLDANVFTDNYSKVTEMERLNYERKIIGAAYEVNRVIKSCHTEVSLNICVLLVGNFYKLYGHDKTGLEMARALEKEINAMRPRVF